MAGDIDLKAEFRHLAEKAELISQDLDRLREEMNREIPEIHQELNAIRISAKETLPFYERFIKNSCMNVTDLYNLICKRNQLREAINATRNLGHDPKLDAYREEKKASLEEVSLKLYEAYLEHLKGAVMSRIKEVS